VAVQLVSDSGPPGAQNWAPEPGLSGALVSPLACAVFASMLRMSLRRRTSASTGIDPRNAAELLAAFHELERVGLAWMASRPRKSAGCVTEINAGSVADMEINTEKAAELLRLPVAAMVLRYRHLRLPALGSLQGELHQLERIGRLRRPGQDQWRSDSPLPEYFVPPRIRNE
jgi:hypothetical protein